MRLFYAIIIGGILVVLGLLFYPSIHLITGAVDTTGFLPLLSAGVAFMPYAFLGFMVYAVIQLKKK
jgi:hypothetical protein